MSSIFLDKNTEKTKLNKSEKFLPICQQAEPQQFNLSISPSINFFHKNE